MVIEWLGQACFVLTLSGGGHLLIDPVPPQLGYHMVAHSIDADLTLVSHNHFDHNWVEAAKNLVEIAPATGPDDPALGWQTYTVAGHHTIRIERIFAYHDNVGGTLRGPDTMTVIDADGLRIAHLGDLGQLALTPDQIGKLGHIDVLMLPVGGFFTIDGPQAAAIVAQVHPRVVIPIHYSTPVLMPDLQSKLATEAPFVDAMKPDADIVYEKDRDLVLTPQTLPKRETVYVLRYQ
jgi:L-ascorbate metabolism protein UlaG (beta-lactamase superfamily)